MENEKNVKFNYEKKKMNKTSEPIKREFEMEKEINKVKDIQYDARFVGNIV